MLCWLWVVGVFFFLVNFNETSQIAYNNAGLSSGHFKQNVFFYRQLIAHLQVFSKFSNPRALYLEQKLNALYTQVMLAYILSKMLNRCVQNSV